ncbi:MAG TPA: H-X9-DG-CTERM domain-containing protein [Chthoniobacteraceae bacterium]|nr:H-X9-DG-CTERM domain-containing protein [Chthoniobacteraceae bacterium]
MSLLGKQTRIFGFSVVELLVVLGVLGLLIAFFIFPVARRALEDGRSARCVSQLRQIGVAVEVYIGEHNQLLPPISPIIGAPHFFQEAVAPYLKVAMPFPFPANSEREEVGAFCCPSDKTPFLSAYRSYAINYYTGRSADFTWRNIARRSECPAPGKIVYLADGYRSDGPAIEKAAARLSPNTTGFTSGERTMGLSFRHGGKVNALWLDGHVSQLGEEQTLDNTAMLYPKDAQ